MPQSKPVIGLTWDPKLPSFANSTKPQSSSSVSTKIDAISALGKPKMELIDGLYVPPNDPRKLNKLRRKQVKDTAGKNWFDMPAPILTPELKLDLKLLKLRGVIDPKRHYVKGDAKSKTLPKYFQASFGIGIHVGTVMESPFESYSSRLTKKERKPTIADELLSDEKLMEYRKRKVREIEENNRPASNEKWKIKGKHTLKRAKQRRH
ncbi:rRNA-processing protein fcf2-like protein [Drosera capensis]